MLVPEIIGHVGRFCAVATKQGLFYGEVVRLSSVWFLIRPRLPPAEAQHAVYAAEILRITPLPDPR